MALKDTIVLIDGGYFSEISKDFGNQKHLKVDILKFSKYLAIKAGYWMDETYYYTAPPFQGTPPTQEEQKLKAGYDKFVSKLKKQGIIVREGRVQKIDSNFCQKGVDTLVVMDLMKIASSKGKKYDTIILLACDTDFVPIIKKLEEEDSIKLHLYYHTDRIRKSKFSMSNEILNACKNKTQLTKEFFTRNLRND
ncbi:MAG: NYN domain-containing protein [archaeon]